MVRALSFVILALAALPAAATTFTAGAGCMSAPARQAVQTYPGTASAPPCDVTVDVAGFSPAATATARSTASAEAGPLGIRLSASSGLFVSGATTGQGTSTAHAYADVTYNDFLISGPGTTPVSSLLNLHISGSMLGFASPDGAGPLTTNIANGVGDIFFQIDVNGAYAGSGQAFYAANRGEIVAVDLLEAGHFDDGDIDAFISSLGFTVPVGQVFSVRIQAFANGNTVLSIAGTPADEHDTVSANAQGFSNFGSTIRFAHAGPVFDLPEGYTVNSPSAGIVDNQLVVPEPATWSLVAVGAIALLARRGSGSRKRVESAKGGGA